MSILTFDEDTEQEDQEAQKNNNQTNNAPIQDYAIEQAIEVPWEMPPALDEYEEESPSALDVISANFRELNSLYLAKQAYDIGRFGNGEVDETFNLKKSLEKEGITDNTGYFADVKNAEQFDSALEYYYQHQKDMETLSNASFTKNMMLGLVTGIADPINYIPVAKAIKYGTTAVKAGIEGAILGGVGSSVAYKVHKDISAEEVVVDTIASGLCSSVLSFLGRKATQTSLKEGFKDFLDDKIKVDEEVVDELLGLKENAIQRARNFFIYPTPQLQAKHSNDPTIRSIADYISYGRQSSWSGYSVQEKINNFNYKFSDVYNKLYEKKDNYVKKQTEFGIPKELAQGLWEAETKKAIFQWIKNPFGKITKRKNTTDLLTLAKEVIDEAKEFDVLPKDFSTEGVTAGDNFILTKKLANMSNDRFDELIDKIKKKEYDTSKLATITEKNYFPRRYSAKKLQENSEYYFDLICRAIRLNHPRMKDIRVKALAYQELAHMAGKGAENTSLNTIKDIPEVVFASRTIPIEDELLFDAFDLDEALRAYYRSLKRITSATALNIASRKVGFKTWKQLEEKYLEKLDLSAGVKFIKGELKPSDIFNYQNNYKLLTDIRLLYMGDFTKNGAFANNRLFKLINVTAPVQYAFQLGSSLIRSVNDLAIDVFHFGFKRTSKNLATILNKERQAHRDKLFNLTFLERMKDNSFRFFIDSEDEEVPSKLRSFLRKTAEFENKVSLQYYWDRALRKTTLEELYSDAIKIACVDDPLALTKREKAFKKALGLNEKNLEYLKEAFSLHGENYKGIYYVDPVFVPDIADKLRNALRTMTDEIILTPSTTNVPIWTRTELGRLVHHFVNYGFMSYEKVFLPMVRGKFGTSKTAQGIAISLALTALSESILNYSNKKDTDWTSFDTWKNIITNSHLINPILNAIDKTTDVLSQGTYAVTERLIPTSAWIANIISALRNLLYGKIDRIKWHKFPILNTWEAKIANRLMEDL